MTVLRAFPVIYANDVGRTAEFWERLGFERFVELRWNDEPGYIGLRRDASEIAVVIWDWRAQRLGLKAPAGPRFEEKQTLQIPPGTRGQPQSNTNYSVPFENATINYWLSRSSTTT